MKKSGLVLLMFFTFLNLIAQNQLFKGQNLLIPSNLIVNYNVRLDTCYRMVNGECIEHVSKAILKNKSENDLITMILNSALSGKVNCYKTDSWLTYQLMENRQKLSESEIENKLGNFDLNTADKKQIVGLNFIEDWEVTNNPLAFKKKVIAYMPLSRYYSDDDSCYENPLYQIPFTIIDTLVAKKQIKKSEKRMILSNIIAYEYFFYLDYTYPYDIDELTKTYKKFGHGVDNYILSKETSEYLTRTGITNFLKIMTDKVINEELIAYDYYDNKRLSVNEVKERLGAIKDTVENANIAGLFSVNYAMPVDFDEIQSVVFLEKWYIDPVTLRIEKKVFGIAPVRHYYSEDDEQEENLKRQILFKIYFNKK
jgi:hypothetical protein